MVSLIYRNFIVGMRKILKFGTDSVDGYENDLIGLQ